MQRLEESRAARDPQFGHPCTGGRNKGVRKGGVGVKSPFELDILQNFITCANEINCFRILFAC